MPSPWRRPTSPPPAARDHLDQLSCPAHLGLGGRRQLHRAGDGHRQSRQQLHGAGDQLHLGQPVADHASVTSPVGGSSTGRRPCPRPSPARPPTTRVARPAATARPSPWRTPRSTGPALPGGPASTSLATTGSTISDWRRSACPAAELAGRRHLHRAGHGYRQGRQHLHGDRRQLHVGQHRAQHGIGHEPGQRLRLPGGQPRRARSRARPPTTRAAPAWRPTARPSPCSAPTAITGPALAGSLEPPSRWRPPTLPPPGTPPPTGVTRPVSCCPPGAWSSTTPTPCRPRPPTTLATPSRGARSNSRGTTPRRRHRRSSRGRLTRRTASQYAHGSLQRVSSGVATGRLHDSAARPPASSVSMSRSSGTTYTVTVAGTLRHRRHVTLTCGWRGRRRSRQHQHGVDLRQHITYDGTKPSGTVTVNGGATYATSTAVTLTLSATDGRLRLSRCSSATTTRTGARGRPTRPRRAGRLPVETA